MNMKNIPLFSVLIANHNDGNFIDYAVESIKKQTYSNWEIIIVDDASTDNSIDVYKKYKNDHRIHISLNDKNYGCGYTKRRLVKLSNGEICGFVDADDALTPEALEIMVDAHINNPDASLIYSYYYACDKKLNVLYTSVQQCQIPDGLSFLEYQKGSVSHFATFKRELYNRTNGINKDFQIAVDMDLYYKLEEVGRLIHIPKPLYYYRMGNTTHTYLGDNAQYALTWNFIAITDACRRRGINIEKYAFPFIDEIVNYKSIKAIQDVKKTPDYKIGYLLLKPYRFIKSIFAKLFNNKP